MLDLSIVSSRYFEIMIDGKKLEVEPPKVKVLRKLLNIAKAGEDQAVEELVDAVRMILNKNRQHYTIPEETIDDLDLDQIQNILESYFSWLSRVHNDPN